MDLLGVRTCWFAMALTTVGCIATARPPSPRPVASIIHDPAATSGERAVALAVARCFPLRERRRLFYTKAAFENGGSPMFVVFLSGPRTAVKALNADLYYDRSRAVVFAVPAEPEVFADSAERRLQECLVRARTPKT